MKRFINHRSVKRFSQAVEKSEARPGFAWTVYGEASADALVRPDFGRSPFFDRGDRVPEDQLGFQFLEAAIEVVDAVHRSFAFSRQARDDEADGGPQVCRHYGRAVEAINAGDNGFVAMHRDLCAKAREFGEIRALAWGP